MDISPHATPGVGQDPAFDTISLASNCDPVYWAEAISNYKDSKPPFVSTSNTLSEGNQRAVFLTKNGQRPLSPIRATLVTRRWVSGAVSGSYWTLDLNGQRFIVQSFPNKGYVGGAKWVYCCWSGRGEEFEDSPIAFTCIHGEYTSTRGPERQSDARPKNATTRNAAVGSAIANKVGRDHPPHVTPLPEDHPVEYLDQAEASYVESRPPFAVRKTKNIRRRVFLATQDGDFSPTSAEAEVVFRSWDELDDYPTIDLDGKRFIVSGNSGGPPGTYQYHLWLGSQTGRVKKVVAYSGPQTTTTKAPSAVTENLARTNENQCSWSPSDDEGDQDLQEGATNNQEYSYESFVEGFDLSAPTPLAPNKFCKAAPMPSSAPSMRQERPRRRLQPTKRARSLTPLAHIGSRKSNTPANVAKRTAHRTRPESDIPSQHSDPPYETPAPTPGTTDPSAPASETQKLQPPQAPASLPFLSSHKQTHTTLRVTRDSNIIGFVPLRLRACMTMSTLFSSVIAASGHKGDDDEEPIKCLMVVFDWKDEHDVYKTMYIDRGTQGSFEIFLEIIVEAPCWKEEGGGKCGIAVEIVRA